MNSLTFDVEDLILRHSRCLVPAWLTFPLVNATLIVSWSSLSTIMLVCPVATLSVVTSLVNTVSITSCLWSLIISSPVYLDVDPINVVDPIRLFAFVGNSGGEAYKWNIKITLIDCKLNNEIQGKIITWYWLITMNHQLHLGVVSITPMCLVLWSLSTMVQDQVHPTWPTLTMQYVSNRDLASVVSSSPLLRPSSLSTATTEQWWSTMVQSVTTTW